MAFRGPGSELSRPRSTASVAALDSSPFWNGCPVSRSACPILYPLIPGDACTIFTTAGSSSSRCFVFAATFLEPAPVSDRCRVLASKLSRSSSTSTSRPTARK